MLTRATMLAIKNSAGIFCFLVLTVLFTGCGPPGSHALWAGKRLLDKGRAEEAIVQLKKAVSVLNTNAPAWNYLGLACHRAGQASNAVPAYLRALGLDHNLVEAHYNLGCLWLEQNRPDAAKAEFTAYTALRGNEAEGWLALGTAQLRLRELAAAEKSFNEALRISPQDPEAINDLGIIQLWRNHARDAAQSFAAALKLRPDFAPALLNLAIVSHSYLNNRQFALAKYQEYLALPVHPPNWDAVNATAHALEQELKPPPPALTSNPPPAASANPRNPHLADSTARPPFATRPQTANATKTPPIESPPVSSVQAVDLSPESPVKSVNIAPPQKAAAASASPGSAGGETIASEKSASAAAQRTISRYKYRSPGKPANGNRAAAEPLFARGAQAQQAGRLPEAVEAYRQAIQLDPAYYEAYYNQALALNKQGHLPAALAAYETALAIQPTSLDARLYFAETLRQANYPLDAINELERVLTEYLDPRAHLALGNIYARTLHQPAKAREHYEKVLELDPGNAAATDIRLWLSANPQ